MYSPISSSLWRGSDGKRLSWNILCSSGILLATSGVFAAYMMTGRNWRSDNLLVGKCWIQPCTREFGRNVRGLVDVTLPQHLESYLGPLPITVISAVSLSAAILWCQCPTWLWPQEATEFCKLLPGSLRSLTYLLTSWLCTLTAPIMSSIVMCSVWCLGALLRDWNEVLRLCIKKELWNLFNALVSPSPSWDWALVKTPLQVFNVFHCFFIWSTFKIAFI